MFKKIVRMFLSLFLVTAIGVGGYAWTIYNQSTDALSRTYKGFGNETNVIAETKPLTILLMGVDTGSGSRSDTWQGNSDSMLLLSVNPQTKKTVMMSLERDILTQIDEKGETTEAKLNAAYAYGGAKLAIATIEKMMNIHIDRYVMINMQGLVQLVDAVGGIEVNNTFDFPISIEENEPEYTATVEPGKHLINGDQALVYARMRYQDPEGDYGRQKRQREVIRKVVEKVLSLNSISHYQAILRAVSKNMQTNVALDSGSIPQLLGYKDAFRNIQSEQLRGEDATLADGGSYQLVTSEHLLEMQNLIRKSLGLSTVKSLKTNAVLYEDLMGGRSLRASNSGSSTAYQQDEPVYSSPTESNYGSANNSNSTPAPPEPSASSEPPASSTPAPTPDPTPSVSSAVQPSTPTSSE
ncbi:LytR family transcriptional regulator [Streptococcus cristatus]|uniref:Transporter n=2 Tax=Streptococcus cristatus TaxID=45634 RepID=A0A512ADD8_STRCR|nr:LCP family protein [Streptococcus cristatus]GEN97703.1 transporter [Streptococcus cristatus]SQI45694.1 LytR family transcriptional regulator [Streptococcus cristatus]